MSLMKTKTKTIFLGTPDFGLPALSALLADPFFSVELVITQPDKKIGRKQILTSPIIKLEALKHNIQVLQPMKVKEAIEEINKIQPDLIVVIAYGQIIPADILNIPKYGCINVHGSLLPKYRGAACIQAAILNGDQESGLTIMKMDAGLDTGPIIYQEKVKIDDQETSNRLYKKLSDLAGKILPNILKKYINNELPLTEQDDTQASYIKTLKKENGLIDWNKPVLEIERQIRAFNPWPGTYSLTTEDQVLKILEIDNIIKTTLAKPGTIMEIDKHLAIQAKDGYLIVKKLQLEGKKPMEAGAFISGYSKLINTQFKEAPSSNG